MCEHNLEKYHCKECNGGSYCEHNIRKRRCAECGGEDLCKANPETRCGLIGNARYQGYCVMCYQYYFPDCPVSINYRAKEKVWADFIRETFPDIDWTFNKSLGGYSRYRPDAFADCGTHVLVGENDEFQHKRGDYSCDNRRTMALMQDCGFRPIVMIRFNPDDYLDEEGKKVTSCWGTDKTGKPRVKPSKKKEWRERLQTFAERIKFHLAHIPEKEVTQEWLYYDHNASET